MKSAFGASSGPATTSAYASFPTKSGRFPKMWARGEWKVLLDTPGDIVRAIRYVEDNPRREGKRPQAWKFVVPYR